MGYFLPFYPPNIAKNENLKIIKKPMEISSCCTSVPKIMIMCYTVPVMWCMMDIIIFHFGLFFALSPPLPPPNNSKNENLEKIKKKHLEIPSFYKSLPKIMIIYYTVPEILHLTDVIAIFYFGLFFALTAQKIKISKKWKKQLDIIILCMCTKNYD